MVEHKFETYIIENKALFERLKAYESAVSDDLIVLDVETDSVIEKLANLYGIGLCFTDKKAFYVPWRDKLGNFVWSEQEREDIKEWLYSVCSKRKLIGHNIIYDVLVLENNLGLDFSKFIYSDTILQKHTLDEEEPFALKEIAVNVLGPWADKAQQDLKQNVLDNGGKWSKENKDMYLADTSVLAEYCSYDVMLTYLLFQKFETKLREEKLHKLFYEEEVMPLYKYVTIDMKRRGFPIDVAYFENLKSEIQKEIINLEDSIINECEKEVPNFIQEVLDKTAPIKNNGLFPKKLAEICGIPLPESKSGTITLSKKALEKQSEVTPEFKEFYGWIIGENDISKIKPILSNVILYGESNLNLKDITIENLCRITQEKIFFSKDSNKDSRYIFNLKSNDHLKAWLVDKLGFTPLEYSDKTKKPKVDEDFLESIKDENQAVQKLLDYKKLNKLLSTYVEGILSRQLDGYIYTSMLQFGTTSGRYSSRSPNCQNLPRIKEGDSGLSPLVLTYTNAIKKGFIAGTGRKVVNADFSSLEPVCFAHASGDEKLIDVFKNGEDLYSRVAIEVFKLKDVSADKKSPNYLKNVYPELRQKAKIFCLAVVYGAEAARISEAMKVSYKEADQIIKAYLDAFPNLRNYMNNCNYQAKKYGYVITEFGRKRHLQKANSLFTLYGNDLLKRKWCEQQERLDKLEQGTLLNQRRVFKNLLNNAKNFPIQGLAAHIVNRAMIDLAKKFKEHSIDGWIALQVHDEITCIVSEAHSKLAAELLQGCMENTTKISIDLHAEPLIADNWAEAK